MTDFQLFRTGLIAIGGTILLSACGDEDPAPTPPPPNPPASDTQAPSKPAGLTASDITHQQIKISWNASTDNVGVAGYKVFRDNAEIADIATTNYTDTGLSQSTQYNYTVSAYDAAGNESDKSDVLSASTTSSDTQAPSKPAGLTASDITHQQIKISWNASTDNVGVVGYKIFRDNVEIADITNTEYTDVGLNQSTQYNYTVSAYDAAGNESDKSDVLSASTTSSDTQAPSKPAGLTASDITYQQIKISWNASTDNVGVVGYKLFRDNTEIADITTTDYTDTGLNQNTQYNYTVSAYDAAGNESQKSDPLSATTAVYSTPSCEHTGSGTDYPVGPGQTYADPSDIDWDSVGAGDTIRIYYRPEAYKNKIVIRTGGTVNQPLRICGVPGPNGERPVFDGDGAINDPDDANGYGTYAPMEGLAMFMIYNRDYDLKDSNIIIEGLHIKNAKNTFSYQRMDGSTDNYESGAACIRVQAGDNIIIRNNELENCSNGIFTMSQGYNEAHLTRDILIEGNYLHGHSEVGRYWEHGLYVQAIGATYQFNHFGPNAAGSGGTSLKERVAGSVIRYNWFTSGSSRFIDLVEVEDAAPWYIEAEYRAWAAQNGEPIDPDRLQKVREAERRYRVSHVYGNFFHHVGSQTESGNIIHYGSDNDPALSRAGTLYFYNNTLSILQDRDDAWRFRLFYLGNRNDTNPSRETVEVFNNIIYLAPEQTSTPSYFCFDSINQGTFNLGVNWITNGWQLDSDNIANCYYGNASETPTINGAGNLIDTSNAPIPIDTATLDPKDVSEIRDKAQSLPSALLPNHAIDKQYVRHQDSENRPEVNDLGAKELP